MAPSTTRRIDLAWPMAGLDRRAGFSRQRPYSTISAENVRPDHQGRERGGQRPGIQLWTGTGAGQCLTDFSYVSNNQTVTRLAAISGGVFYYEAAPQVMVPVSGSLHNSKLIPIAAWKENLYLADHHDDPSLSAGARHPKRFNPQLPLSLTMWAASRGTTPTGCIALCQWRERLILGGGTSNPFGLHASRQGDPDDFDFTQEDAQAAWSVVLPDSITALIPYEETSLIIGGSSTLWLMMGDPTYGGQLQNLSRTIGIVQKNAFCMTPDNHLVFLSRDGLYAIQAGAPGLPESLSRERLPEELIGIDPDRHAIAMGYDVRDRGIYIFVTASTTAGGRHFWFDWETRSFWPIRFNSAINPYTVLARRNYPLAQSDADSTLFFGNPGGIFRFIADTTADYNGNIASHVCFGPFGDPGGMEDTRWDELGVTLAAGSGDVRWEIFAADTAEEAAAAAQDPSAHPDEGGLLQAGKNAPAHPRVRGGALYLKLSAVNIDNFGWGFESGYALLTRVGRSRGGTRRQC